MGEENLFLQGLQFLIEPTMDNYAEKKIQQESDSTQLRACFLGQVTQDAMGALSMNQNVHNTVL